jgi:NADPH:quinone reductase-like Zn-dependent oxidoreductase
MSAVEIRSFGRPEGLSAVDAVTLGSSGVVAHFALAHARFAAGESVLVRGAAGSIGIMTVQLAARGGASAVAVTTSSAERGDRLRQLGATHVLELVVHEVLPLEQAVLAHQKMEAGEVFGRIALMPSRS